MSKHLKIMDNLFKLAISVEPVGNAKIASALVYKNDIISYGICKNKTHPIQAKYSRNSDSIYLHAENDCIINARRYVNKNELSKSILYIMRVKRTCPKSNFVCGLAKPCKGCMMAIEANNICKIVYSDNDNDFKIMNRKWI
jgi:deoxycytidylate deaminase